MNYSKKLIKGDLLEQYGFESKIDYDKDFPDDKYYTMKTVTYTKPIVGELSIYVTDIFDFKNPPDEWHYKKTTIEIHMGCEFQEINITKMWQLISLMNLLQILKK